LKNERKRTGNKRKKRERKKKKQKIRVVNELPLSAFETMVTPCLFLH
jgi:hypothetical protein